MTPITQKRPKSEVKSNDNQEEELCPICGEPFDDAYLIEQLTIIPEKLDNKFCLESVGISIAVFKHERIEEFNEEQAVNIEVE